jgi:thymidine kinase
MHGKLILVIGPMMAGKTEFMLSKVNQYFHKNKKCCFVKFVDDNRYSDKSKSKPIKIITHSENFNNEKVPVLIASKISDIFDELKQYDVIGISEGQFFEDIELIDVLAKSRVVVCEGLKSSHTRENLGSLYKLYPLADDIHFLKGVCSCGNDTVYTKKIKGNPDKLVEIGGPNMYMPVCRHCY